VSLTPPVSAEAVPLRIGELAKRAGLTTRTLRYWEELGIVKPIDHLCSGERLYRPAELERVVHIRELQELLGLTLAEIRIVLESEDAVERARNARLAGASTLRRLALIDDAIEAHTRLIEKMDDRLARIAAFRDEWVQRGERMRERSVELRSEADTREKGSKGR
jgi:MerR family transcriptional regulator, repressor of the yfmOP operon